MSYSKYMEYKDQNISQMIRIFSNVVVYDHLKNKDLIVSYLKKEILNKNHNAIEQNVYREILNIDNAKEKDIIVAKIKNINVRICEISNSLYNQSKLSDYIQYSEVSSDLAIAVKSAFILSMSKANPTKSMVRRIDECLVASKKDFAERNKSTYDICKMAIYFSVLSPEYISKHKGDIQKSVYGTKGGKALLDSVAREMEAFKGTGRLSFFESFSFWLSTKRFNKHINGC